MAILMILIVGSVGQILLDGDDKRVVERTWCCMSEVVLLIDKLMLVKHMIVDRGKLE